MNKNSQQLIVGYPRHQIIRVIAGVIVVVALVVGYKVFISEPSDAASAQVICEMRTAADSPLLDTAQANTREDLAKALKERASAMEDAAGKTGGDISDSLSSYASAMKKIANSIADDSTGASLAEVVSELATNKDIASAEATLKAILETRCD
jgi:hypothetical protein